MGGSAHASFTMAALMAAGGVFAFARKGSKPSLIAGCGVGALFLGSGLIIQAGAHKEGHGLALVTSLILLGGMGRRTASTKKFMPAGLIASLGGISAIYQASKVREWM